MWLVSLPRLNLHQSLCNLVIVVHVLLTEWLVECTTKITCNITYWCGCYMQCYLSPWLSSSPRCITWFVFVSHKRMHPVHMMLRFTDASANSISDNMWPSSFVWSLVHGGRAYWTNLWCSKLLKHQEFRCFRDSGVLNLGIRSTVDLAIQETVLCSRFGCSKSTNIQTCFMPSTILFYHPPFRVTPKEIGKTYDWCRA